MCCLRYEHEFYVQSRKRFPKEGKLIRTKRGEEKVLANDIFRDRVTLRGEDGEVRTIELAELRNEAETVGAPLPISMTAIATDDSTGRGDDTDVAIDVAIDEELIEETIVITEVTVSETAEIEIPPADVAPQPQAADGRERRPHRRRGRRGGRRNRQGGGRPNAEGGDAAEGGGDGGDGSDAGEAE
jgi:hypothetical protein